ncbi:MAG: iron-siderophore ABC transporter substrate-binding protein [Chloroflexi bacterium]|nr:iron-siderophore ABC transporter substrate-binding protein [Chloroflexota bacterium]
MILASLLLAGCQSSAPAVTSQPNSSLSASPAASAVAEASASPAESPAATEAAAAPTDATRTVADALGAEIEVPAAPQRIVVLTQEDLDAALALGVMPAGITNGQGQNTPPRYLGERVAGLRVVGDLLRPNLESVAAVNPDLILAGDMNDEQVIAQLGEIAPTVVTMDVDDDWKTHFAKVAEVLNKQDAGTRVLADYDAEVQAVKAALGANANARVSVVRWGPTGPSYMQPKQFSVLVLTDLGLQRPAHQPDDGFTHSMPLSLEQINLIDGDWLFLGTLSPEGEDATAMQSARDTPVFQQLAAVKNNHVVAIDGAVWSSRGGVLAAQVVLDDVRKALSAS